MKVDKCASGMFLSTTYLPVGMLDRDQRTIITISPKKSREKTIKNYVFINKISRFSCATKCISPLNSNTLNIKNKSNYFQNDKIYFCCDKDKKLSVLPINEKIYQNQNYKFNIQKRNICRSRKSKYSLKWTKLNSLLFCICFLLFILQKTRALPLKMTEENNHHNHHHHQQHRRHHNDVPLECRDIRDVIDKILRQANVSYELNYAKLENFTQTVFKEHHQDHHNEWRHRHFDWLYPNKQQLKISDYDKQVPEEALSHLRLSGAPDRQELSRELTDLYIRLKILAMAIENIRNDHDQNIYELMSRYPNEKHIHIVDYFKEQDRYIRALLTETGSAMRKLGIPIPNYVVDSDGLRSYQGVRDLRDWIVTREHLKLLHYVLKVYEILVNRCS